MGRYQRRKRRNQGDTSIGWLIAGGLGLLYLIDKASQPHVAIQPQYIGPPRAMVDRVATSQEESMWCWAASIQTILHSYGVPITQKQIVARVYGNPMNEPGTDAAISASLNGWAFDFLGRKVIIQSRVAQGPPPLAVLVQEIARQHPILVTFNHSPSTTGHAVVITGASHVGLRVTSLVYRDPWPSTENCANNGRVEIIESEVMQFLYYVQSHWLVSASFA
jgi:Papain-like cysteine protease AvrRpt2